MMTASKPHAEIAGGGIAGLMMACVLGKRGWSVRLHERGEVAPIRQTTRRRD